MAGYGNGEGVRIQKRETRDLDAFSVDQICYCCPILHGRHVVNEHEQHKDSRALATQLRDAAAGRELVGSRDMCIWTRKTRAVSSMGHHYLCRYRGSPSGVRGRRTDRKTWSLSPRCCIRWHDVAHALTLEFSDRRVIRLQKIPDEVLDDQMPHTLSLSAHDELADLTKPGSRLTGIFGSLSVRMKLETNLDVSCIQVEDAIGGTPTELEAKLIELTKCESAEQKRLVNKMLARWEACGVGD
ncbi:hypothetical protein L210DRAFT_3519414 [Boletus edulis BED1]|uniref:MCM OB domain-containing protein n=1 Tax=Boletus edulis BED1 TaxID=1328754 RepID=A0AAD4CAH0_BOLED|nr:hypothetical protein L210DRAFT_3519414 [Boletus edulis BED1]